MNPVDTAEQMIAKGGHVHFVGIGGIGMAGLACLLNQRGFKVSGCDQQENRQTKWLQNSGVQISFNHDESHIDESVDWLIRTTAVPETHPEVQRALKLNIPVSRRGEVLPALSHDLYTIAVCGSHGKTTTTAMIAQVLDCGYFVGGEVVGTDAIARDGEIMVVEADESDGTLAGYTPDVTVITNIEYDHMEHHDSEETFIRCFEQIIRNTKERVYYRSDDPIAVNVCTNNSKCVPFALPAKPIQLPLPGEYNQWNASAALHVCRQWLPEEKIIKRLKTIQPIRRRFETIFDANGIRVISDYAHHPTEIRALIKAAGELKPKRLLAVFQPHRYTRTLALGPDFPPAFDGVDKLWITPVYAASEHSLEGGTSVDLINRFPKEWGGRINESDSIGDAWNSIRAELIEGDLLLIIGAGDIEQLAEQIKLMTVIP